MRARFIYEKFTQDSDPIKDIGIGRKYLIEKWIKKIRKICSEKSYYDPFIEGLYNIDNVFKININENGFIPDNYGDLPEYIQFGKIKKSFYMDSCKLTTLRGSPERIGGDFLCYNNLLTSLEYAPKFVGGDFICGDNKKKFTKADVRKVCKVKGNIIV